MRVETDMACGFLYLEFTLNEISGSFQYTVSIDTSVQFKEYAFSTVPMTILAASTSKQLVLFQARPIQKRIRPFNAAISPEV